MGSDPIAVVGAGSVGGALARKWAAAGHPVLLGTRDPSSSPAGALATELGHGARAVTARRAVEGAPVVVFAVPGGAMGGTVGGLGHLLDGKVVVDATNTMTGGSMNSIDIITAAAPAARAYRAFNTLGWENFADPVIGGERADLFFCGPDGPGRSTLEALVDEVGLRPVWVGDLDQMVLVDNLARLWFTLALGRGFGRHTALRVLSDR